ncbi:MAG: DUF1631 family protein [Ramlibacter sp.]|nr:DUF1631 family protein [Ramlibacter sp.]
MNEPQLPRETAARLARQARDHFVLQAQAGVVPMLQAVRARLSELAESAGGSREMYERRDALLDFERKGAFWGKTIVAAWRKAVVPPAVTARSRLDSVDLELIGDEVVENKILAGRIALSIQEKTSFEANELRVRMQYLDGTEELASSDVLRPEALALMVIEQWTSAGLTREVWTMAQETVQKQLAEHIPNAYKSTNDFLIQQGVLRDIDLAARVKRTSSSPAARRPESTAPGASPASSDGQPGRADSGSGDFGQPAGQSGPYGNQGGHGDYGGYGGHSGGGTSGGTGAGSGGPYGSSPEGAAGGAAGGGHGATGGSSGSGAGRGGNTGGAGGSAGPAYGAHGQGRQGDQPANGVNGVSGMSGGPAGAMTHPGSGQPSRPGAGAGAGVADETRMMTATPPLARARARASGVLGQLKRLLADRIPGFDPAVPVTRPSPALAQALQQHQATQAHSTQMAATPSQVAAQEIVVYDDAAVQEVAVDLRRRSGELKKKANTQTEKATIEIVALMFQSILSEERIPPAVRVWFARLQMPVLRVAIAEPEFFGSLEHPARQLIDRMGSVVMGFNAATIGGSTLEVEIKRVVQVIEQYPETGRRVFQLVYDEFQKFLARFLTENGETQKLVSVAQQVEQKETLAIQYTIEMRSMLADLPIRDEIRDFLFKIWAEVLAMAAIRHGPQHADTLALKASASELVWAASAKPNRAERARVIKDLPALLLRLRQGMTLVNIEGAAQEAQIKSIGDTLADAFLSKTQAIPQAQIESMARRLAHLEDFVSDDPTTDLPLDRESIEMMLGIDASNIEVVADGGSRPSQAMLAWATELPLGNWFALDHNGVTAQVQYVWRSDRKQLHLFAAPGGRSYLLQNRRLASYLQAGLLLPAEEEALTVRATRDALAKLDANPERLLQ